MSDVSSHATAMERSDHIVDLAALEGRRQGIPLVMTPRKLRNAGSDGGPATISSESASLAIVEATAISTMPCLPSREKHIIPE